jgi:hypothetical protein
MVINHPPRRLFIQMFGRNVTALENDPRKFHDNGKPVHQYLHEDIIKALLNVMEIQESRDSGEFHLSIEAFRPMWDEAKSNAYKEL